MRLELIDGIRMLIIAFLAYIPTVTISGWFTAWVAKKCDDDLPERLGFLTLDPFAHFSLVGFALLLIGTFFGSYITLFKDFPGFGRYIFLEPAPTTSKAKAALEFFARALAHFIMLSTIFLIMFVFFKSSFFSLSFWTSQVEPFLSAVKYVSFFFFKQNMILCNIYFLFGVADIICFSFSIPRFFSMHYFVILIVTLLLLSDLVSLLLTKYLGLLQYVFAA